MDPHISFSTDALPETTLTFIHLLVLLWTLIISCCCPTTRFSWRIRFVYIYLYENSHDSQVLIMHRWTSEALSLKKAFWVSVSLSFCLVYTLRRTGNTSSTPTCTLTACWSWYNVKGQAGVLIQTARWMTGSPSYFFYGPFSLQTWPFGWQPREEHFMGARRVTPGKMKGYRERGCEGWKKMQRQLSLKCHKLLFRGGKTCTFVCS